MGQQHSLPLTTTKNYLAQNFHTLVKYGLDWGLKQCPESYHVDKWTQKLSKIVATLFQVMVYLYVFLTSFQLPWSSGMNKIHLCHIHHCVSRWSGRWTASSTDWPKTKTDGVLLRKCLQRTKVGILLLKCRFCKLYILVSGGRGKYLQQLWCVNWKAGYRGLQWMAGGRKNRPFPLCVPCPRQRRKHNWRLAVAGCFSIWNPMILSLFLISFQTLMEEDLLTSDIPKSPWT